MALGAFTSLTGGGGLSTSSSAESGGESVTGSIGVGGLNVGGTPKQNQTLFIVAGIVAVAVIFFLISR